MVNAIIGGNLGNNMFQYAFSRLLAEHMGYRLQLQPDNMKKLLQLFPNTAEPVDGRTVYDPYFLFGEMSMLTNRSITLGEIASLYQGYLVETNGCFERSYFYVNEREKLRHWFDFKRREPVDFPVVNIRGGDLRKDALADGFDYYKKAISSLKPGAIIVTDDPSWSFVRALGLPVYHDSPLNDFLLVSAAPELVIGRSTFSWWAAFLGRAKRVIQPEPIQGWRSLKKAHQAYLGVPEWEKIEVA